MTREILYFLKINVTIGSQWMGMPATQKTLELPPSKLIILTLVDVNSDP